MNSNDLDDRDPALSEGRCRFVSGHAQPCEAERKSAKAETKPDTRDGAPKLAGERKRKDLAFRPRKREGAMRQQRL